VQLAAFIADQRPPPARVLEVGCGEGALTIALSEAGYDAIGIDPAAPPGDLFRRIKLGDLEESDPYDVVVAASSLHHITDLDGALDKVVRLLRGRGVLVVDEFAWDRLDAATADWFHGRQRALAAAGRARDVPASLEDCRRDWEDEHVGLHGYETLREALAARFEELHFESRPYLHRLLDGVAGEALEQSLIDSQAIQALGFRFVGTPRA
jgi:SAM-dependent methyltransferase